ncbi:MAG: penicillin-binding protein 2 [Candidatus Moraniibacteriota bacterium]
MNIFNKKNNKQGIELDNPILMEGDLNQTRKKTQEDEADKTNFRIVGALFIVVGMILFGRVVFLQIVKGSHYKTIAEENRIKSQVVKAPRGLIVDENDEILARNAPGFDLVFVPIEMTKNNSERRELYKKISEETEMNLETVRSVIESQDKNSRKTFLIKPGIEHEKALILMEKFQEFRGIELEKTAKRKYMDGEIFSPVIGYTGKITKEEMGENPEYLMTDYIGKRGLEYTYEKHLRGRHGEHRVEVDSKGDIKENLGYTAPEKGDKLVLNLNADLQRISYKTLNKILEENKEASGAALVAMNPQDGGILSMASLPSYNNNLFAETIKIDKYQELLNDPLSPMLNRAVSGEYPPGSTFKPIVALAGLEEGIIGEDTVIECPGKISHGSWDFNDWKTHGKTDLNKAIAESCNVYFYSLGGGWREIDGLGPNKMSKYAGYLGLGDDLGVDVTGESSGDIPDKEWKFQEIGEKWYIGDSYHMAIGQGFVSATPLQMANATSAIANGGKLFRPQLVDKIVDSKEKEVDLKEEVINSGFASEENLKAIKEAMRETVISGSGSSLNDMETEVSAKTGTAQFGGEDKTHSWFISFAPYDNPEIAMAVFIEGGGEGHDWAVPATEIILRSYFKEEEEEIDFKEISSIVENRNGDTEEAESEDEEE